MCEQWKWKECLWERTLLRWKGGVYPQWFFLFFLLICCQNLLKSAEFVGRSVQMCSYLLTGTFYCCFRRLGGKRRRGLGHQGQWCRSHCGLNGSINLRAKTVNGVQAEDVCLPVRALKPLTSWTCWTWGFALNLCASLHNRQQVMETHCLKTKNSS